jgi:hypothetical protein
LCALVMGIMYLFQRCVFPLILSILSSSHHTSFAQASSPSASCRPLKKCLSFFSILPSSHHCLHRLHPHRPAVSPHKSIIRGLCSAGRPRGGPLSSATGTGSVGDAVLFQSHQRRCARSSECKPYVCVCVCTVCVVRARVFMCCSAKGVFTARVP